MKRRMTDTVKSLAPNLMLLSISLILGLLLCEVALRLFFPRYEYAADTQFAEDTTRIWARQANTRESRQHPDSGLPHPVYHNNLALRQHRNFSEADLESAVNVAFFGDSFMENLRLPAQYSLTEPLDYLLNQSGGRFNVLNFGVDGYGTDQSFLHYRDFDHAQRLRYVFYVFSANDLRNIYENNLYALDDSGLLSRTFRVESPLWMRWVSRFHLTYLLLDVQQRLTSTDDTFDSGNLYDAYLQQQYQQKEAYLSEQYQQRFHSPRADAISDSLYNKQDNEDLERSIALFNAILREWKQTVEENGGHFYVVVLPKERESLASHVIGKDFNVVNLYELLKDADPDYDYETVRFTNDGHWNEAGNMQAAMHLYRFLEQEANLTPMPDAQLEEEIYTYYSAFPAGWMPPNWSRPTSASPETLARIQQKYLALELAETATQ